MENNDVLNKIYEEALKRKEELDESKLVIAIAGAGCIGKTTFAKELQQRFEDAEFVELDGYMLPREEAYKIQPGMTGYDPRRNEIDKAKVDLSNLINKDVPYTLYVYNRANHQRDIEVLLEPKDIIIIDGVHALNEKILSLSNFRIFFDSSKEIQYELRFRRESKEFGYDEEKVKERIETYYPDYLNHVASTKKYANYILETNLDYKLSIKNNE